MDLRFKVPGTMTVAGPSMSGKTTFVRDLIKHIQVLNHIPRHILWCYGSVKSENLKVDFHKGIPSHIKPNSLVILDDLMSEKVDDNLFTRDVHHKNLFLIYITQNLFSKDNRTRSLNSHYLVLFKSPRDSSIIISLAKQMYPGNTKFLTSAYLDATRKPHSYLLIDLHQKTSDDLRIRSNIFKVPMIVYKQHSRFDNN